MPEAAPCGDDEFYPEWVESIRREEEMPMPPSWAHELQEVCRDTMREAQEARDRDWREFEAALRQANIVRDDLHPCPACKLRHHEEPANWQPRAMGFVQPDGSFKPMFSLGDPRCGMHAEFFHWRYAEVLENLE